MSLGGGPISKNSLLVMLLPALSIIFSPTKLNSTIKTNIFYNNRFVTNKKLMGLIFWVLLRWALSIECNEQFTTNKKMFGPYFKNWALFGKQLGLIKEIKHNSFLTKK